MRERGGQGGSGWDAQGFAKPGSELSGGGLLVERSPTKPSVGGALLEERSSPSPGGGALITERDGSSATRGVSNIDLRKGVSSRAPATVGETPGGAPELLDPETLRNELANLRRVEVKTLLELLFPDRNAAAMYREPPSAALLAERVARAESVLHEYDVDPRDARKKEISDARQHFEALCRGLPQERELRHREAVERVRDQQRQKFREEVPRHATPPGSKNLYATDVLKIEHAARSLGISSAEARSLASAAGYELFTGESYAWEACDALPTRPATLSDVARALLNDAAEGTRALQSTAISAWLRSNRSPELADEVAQHELRARQPGAEDLARHLAAWSLGVPEVCWRGQAFASPDELGRRWADGRTDDRTVTGLAQCGVLAAWFGKLDERVLQARANAVAQYAGNGLALSQLRWSLGVPWVVGGEAFEDVRQFADRVRGDPAIAEAALREASTGVLNAWLESLPAGRGDPRWREELEAVELRRHGDYCGFWCGVLRNARDGSLHLRRDGEQAVLADTHALLQATLAARFWDALKPMRTSGQLAAFLLTARLHPRPLSALPPYDPREPIDLSLNQLLWSLGARGMVVEWGERDQPVQVPEDLARLYEEDAARFEEELSKEYPLEWLQRQYGADQTWAPALAFVRKVMLGRVPFGFVGAAVAICARRGGPMPVDPKRPGEGQVIDLLPPGFAPEHDWMALEGHLSSGLVLLWLIGQSEVGYREFGHRALTQWWGGGPLPPQQLGELLGSLGSPRIFMQAGRSAPLPRISLRPGVPSARPAAMPVAEAGAKGWKLLGFMALSVAITGGVLLWISLGPSTETRRPGTLPVAGPLVDGGLGTRAASSSSSSAPAPAVPRLRCWFPSAPTRLGNYGSPNHGATLSLFSDRVGVGWVVSGRRGLRGTDYAAASVVSLDGQVLQVLDPEVLDETEYPEFNPRSVGRVTVRWTPTGVPSVLSDEVNATPTDETMRCAGLSVRWGVRREDVFPGDPEPLDGTDPLTGTQPAWTAELLQPYWCRTVNPASPFVLAQQLMVERDGRPQRRSAFLASAPDTWGPVTVTDFPLNRTTIQRVPTVPDPRRVLKDRVADEWRAVGVEGGGYVVVWRESDKIRGMWLDPGFRLVGSVWSLQTNDRNSAPEVRMVGREGLLLFSTQIAPAVGSPFRIAAAPLNFGASPSGYRWLGVGVDDLRTSHVAPALAALPGSRWLMAFTVRPLRGNAATPDLPNDTVHLQAFDAGLNALMEPMVIRTDSRDPELVVVGSRVLVVFFGIPNPSGAAVSAYAGSCE